MPVFTQSRKGAQESEPTFTIVSQVIHGRSQRLLPALPASSLLRTVCRKAAVEQMPWRGSMLFLLSVISPCMAELQVRAGNGATDGYVKKVHEAPSPRCFPELRSLKCHVVLFWNLSVKIRKPLFFFFATFTTISKDFTIHEACKRS